MNAIPIDQLLLKSATGLQIKIFNPDDRSKDDLDTIGAHRDDHFIFFLLEQGSGTVKIELQDITLTKGQLFFIAPSQVHHRIKTANARGWFVAVDISLIPLEYRNIFEPRIIVQHPVSLSDDELKQYSALLTLLFEAFTNRQQENLYQPIIHSLVEAFTGMVAVHYKQVNTIDNKYSRSAVLTSQFKKLLVINSHKLMSPSAYAEQLNVSLGHLNGSVKKITGSPVSYWIQQELFMEAKRLLYHSDLEVKLIANELGYADYSYFSRSFRKAVGISPTEFRHISLLQAGNLLP
jgi:AraC family transcriptional activator of pobA